MLDAKPFLPGASPCSLHFIGDKVASILLYDAERHLEILFGRSDKAADALDGLCQECGDPAGGGELDDILDIFDARHFAVGILQSQWAAVTIRIHDVRDTDFDCSASPPVH